MATSFEKLAAHAQTWIRDVHPKVVRTAHLVAQYSIKADRQYQTLIQTIRELQRAPHDPNLRARLMRLSGRLAGEVEGCLSETRDVAGELGELVPQVRVALEEYEAIKGELEHSYEIKEKDLKRIDEELRNAEKGLADANARYTDAVLVASTTGAVAAFTVLPAIILSVSLLFVFAVAVPGGTSAAAAAAGVAAAKAAQDIKRFNDKVALLGAKRARNLRLHAALRLAQTAATGFAGCAEAVMPRLEDAVLGWRQLKNDLDTLGKVAEDDPNKVPLLFRTAELEASRAAWRELGRAADRYRVQAYVRILAGSDEEEESEDAALSESAQPAESQADDPARDLQAEGG